MIIQTPWFERKFNFDFPTGLFPVIFSRLEGSIFRLHTLLLNADKNSANGIKMAGLSNNILVICMTLKTCGGSD